MTSDPVLVAPNKLFYGLLTNTSKAVVHEPKCTIVAHLMDSSVSIITSEAVFLKTKLKTKDAVHYKPLIWRNVQGTHHKGVEALDDRKLKLASKRKVYLPHYYTDYGD